MGLISRLAILLIFGFTSSNDLQGSDHQFVNTVIYSDLKEECFLFVGSVQRISQIWEWPDSMTKNILKIHLEAYLIEDLNTPESLQLHSKYEALDWNILEMMNFHLSLDE